MWHSSIEKGIESFLVLLFDYSSIVYNPYSFKEKMQIAVCHFFCIEITKYLMDRFAIQSVQVQSLLM